MAFLPPPTSGYSFVGLENLHNDIYPSISPTLTTSLSQPGKTILITGAGRGIGRAIALQYALAGVETIILCARTSSELDEVEAAISTASKGSVNVRKEVVSITDGQAVKALAKTVDTLDVLVNNAGMSSDWIGLGQQEPDEWWSTMEVNVKGTLNFLHAFLPALLRSREQSGRHVNVINVTSIGALMLTPGGSAYQISKMAVQRLSEAVALEYGEKGVNVVGLHPGGVLTKLSEGVEAVKPYLVDTAELCGGFVVWLTNKDREWLNGRYLSATWDVDALENLKEEIVAEDKLKLKLVI